MLDISAQELFEQLQQYQESGRLEAKLGSEIGSSIMQSINAFANEPDLGGGYLLLGIAEPDDEHENYWVAGITNRDKLLNELQTNCREQFEQPIPIQVAEPQLSMIEGKNVLLIFVPELPASAKPCIFKGKLDSKNRRKTGVWRRGVNSDYECSQTELEPILLAKLGCSFEQTILPSAHWDDLDPRAIMQYRKLREKVRPDAEELQANDEEMLLALNLVVRQNGEFVPNVAGLLMLGKPLALRRLLPDMRIDYVRIRGIEWQQDGIISTMDLREALIFLIPKLEREILSDMPRMFKMEDNSLQRSDVSKLPYKVVRETLVNAVMHRDYLTKSPTIIIRFDNRLEVKNAGYSLKPTEQLGEYGSKLRNPVLATVLYDLNFAETKGSGIRKIRQELSNADLSKPVFISDHFGHYFQAIYLLHQFFNESQLSWLAKFKEEELSDDEAMALVLAKETGFVNNQSLRSLSDLDNSSVTRLLAKLTNQKGLLEKQKTGKATYYTLSTKALSDRYDGVFSYDGTLTYGVSPQVSPPSYPSSTPQATPQVMLLLGVLGNLELDRNSLKSLLNLKDSKNFRERYLKPALDAGLIEMTIPDKPTSSQQKYRRKINKEQK